ncbi:PREDICTED: protein FAM122A isoform X2 [Nicrophorus vespilloides]|uniref:Protein FAM122A isoform X2 n=1 Tax=Nicrophorus vespilloides TaxID=110193 RepID=A0ABM1MGW0_NICVS|nr:PREDICTED: protein FAM122A isoform X2 [Nicrophorus vespilloides]
MSSSQGTDMDVDSPSGTLKRCSSAPMINENNTGMTTSPPATTSTRESGSFNFFGAQNPPRTRRFSASCSPLTGSLGSNVRLAPRINQLRQEEFADLSNSRELAHEREIHHTMQISQSWEDLRLVTESPKPNKMAPLHVNLPPYNMGYNSPSPTRLNSPVQSFQSPTRTARTYVRRSASPVLRPSPLGVKRKLDEDKSEYHLSPRTKRVPSYTNSDRVGLLTTSSPVPGSLSSIGTPESISSADSPNFQCRMIDSPSPSRSTESMATSKHDQEMAEGPS